MKMTATDRRVIENARGRIALEARRLMDLSEKYKFAEADAGDFGPYAQRLWCAGKQAIGVSIMLRDEILPGVES